MIFMVVGGISFIKERTDLESSFDSYHIGESRTKGLLWEDRICPKGDLQGIPKVSVAWGSKNPAQFYMHPNYPIEQCCCSSVIQFFQNVLIWWTSFCQVCLLLFLWVSYKFMPTSSIIITTHFIFCWSPFQFFSIFSSIRSSPCPLYIVCLKYSDFWLLIMIPIMGLV